MLNLRLHFLTLLICCVGWSARTAQAQAAPNILVIWGDDIGHDNISAYSRGMMGGGTPNIDRIAAEGALFTDAYAHRSFFERCQFAKLPFLGFSVLKW